MAPRIRNRLYFDVTNSTDRKRCAACQRIVPLSQVEAHAAQEHGIQPDLVIVEPGLKA